jgi:hypothetical protein
VREPANDKQLEFRFEYSMEPCDHVKYLMRIGDFKTFDEFSAWQREPLDDWEEPDWAESAFREMGCFDEDEDDDPAILEYMTAYEEAYLQEKEDRLIRDYRARQAREASA